LRNIEGLWRGNSPGRPPGVPNRATRDARTLCQELIADPEYFASFQRRWRAGELAPVLEKLVWEFAFGRPSQAVTVSSGQLTLAQLIVGDVPEESSEDDS